MNTNAFRRRNESDSIGSSTDRRRDESKPLDLSQFIGTQAYFRQPFSRVLYTEGVQYFAKNAGGGAYWFLDKCFIEFEPKFREEPFLSIKLEVKDSKATITIGDGNDKLDSKNIPYTDCPDGSYNFYIVDGGDHKVLMLASEY